MNIVVQFGHQRNLFHSWIVKIILLLFAECCVFGDIYETVYWSPQNPKFRYTKEQFAAGKAYFERAVMPMSSFYLQCPNLVQIDQQLKNIPSMDKLYENIWLVDKEDFLDCNINISKTHSHSPLHKCDPFGPSKQHHYLLRFLKRSPGESIEIVEGKTYYFVATSDGNKKSLNSSSGGHCNDSVIGISMRMAVYVCFTSFKDPRCHEQPVKPTRVVEVTRKPINESGDHIVMTSAKREKPEDIWQKLTIVFAVAFGASFLVNAICLVVMCFRKSRATSRHNSYADEEPLKTIMTDGKKPHGRTSAAL